MNFHRYFSQHGPLLLNKNPRTMLNPTLITTSLLTPHKTITPPPSPPLLHLFASRKRHSCLQIQIYLPWYVGGRIWKVSNMCLVAPNRSLLWEGTLGISPAPSRSFSRPTWNTTSSPETTKQKTTLPEEEWLADLDVLVSILHKWVKREGKVDNFTAKIVQNSDGFCSDSKKEASKKLRLKQVLRFVFFIQVLEFCRLTWLFSFIPHELVDSRQIAIPKNPWYTTISLHQTKSLSKAPK